MKLKYFLFLFLTLTIIHQKSSIATVRYVSKTGTSVAPYTSWLTAADSIQKCINICVNGDTVLVANGVYTEKITVNTFIWLLGMSMDSTIIDGANATPLGVVEFSANSIMENFTVIGNGTLAPAGIRTFNANIELRNCKIRDVAYGINIQRSSSIVENCIIINCSEQGIDDECAPDTCNSVYRNNIIISNSASSGVVFNFGGYPTFMNNILIEEGNTWTGVSVGTVRGAVIKNNLISGYLVENIHIGDIRTDTAKIINNVSRDVPPSPWGNGPGILTMTGHRTQIKNNIIANTFTGLDGYHSNDSTTGDYNLFWNVTNLTAGNASLGDSNIVADPMFVKDTIPNSELDFDFHLQTYSPAIDKGDSNISDVDGSRSDIGMFGGPGGQRYTYMDLAPKPPSNLTASMDSGFVKLKWNKNTEADFFRYRVYRDTVPNFMYDTTKIIVVISDTIFYDDPPQKYISGNYYYKITALDNAQHQSAASEEVHINITGIPEAPPIVVEHYRLLNNYPNPFNPSTTIPYRLKEGGYVKVMVYNILGERVRVLVNKYQNAGYYEVVFNPDASERKNAEGFVEFETGYGDIVSGIYLYRIEVIGEGNIPVFTDMKKMMLVK